MKTIRILIALALAVISSGHVAHAANARPRAYSVQGVPYTKQMPNYCGPASLCSLLTFYNVKTDQKDIGSCVYDGETRGTNAGDLLLYCREHGLSAYSLNGKLGDLKQFISQGYPVIVLQDYAQDDASGHYRVAVGYDDESGTITFRDSMRPDPLEMKYSDFDLLWNRRGRWAMLVAPQDKDIFQKTLGERNPVLCMDLAQAYLHKGFYDLAEIESTKALSIEPSNQYAKKLLNSAKSHTFVKL
jgi:uncharacterized protein